MASPKVMSVVSAIVWVLQKILFVIYKMPVVGYYLDFLSLWLVALLRFGCGIRIADGVTECKRPKELLILYEYEGCPFCKKVREVLSFLDLDAMIVPCPREGMYSYTSYTYISHTNPYRFEEFWSGLQAIKIQTRGPRFGWKSTISIPRRSKQ